MEANQEGKTNLQEQESGQYVMSDEEFAREKAALLGGNEPPEWFTAGYDEKKLIEQTDDDSNGVSDERQVDTQDQGDDQSSSVDGANDQQVSDAQTADTQQDKPLMVLKHRGNTVEIRDPAMLYELASKGLDYTQKTQALSRFGKIISALEAHGDLRDELIRRMQGGQPPQPIDNRQESGKNDQPEDIFVMRDDETHEAYTKRMSEEVMRRAEAIAAAKAEEAAARSLEEARTAALRARLVEEAKKDPHFPDVMLLLRHGLQNGLIPAEVAKAADSDPQAFLYLYNDLRGKAIAIRGLHQQQKQQQSHGSSNVSGYSGRAVPPPSTPPHAESASRRGEVQKRKSNDIDAQVISDLEALSSDEFMKLAERVKAGMVR